MLYSVTRLKHGETSFGVLQDMLAKKEFNDVTFVCEGKYLVAHKLVLSSCSPVFRKHLSQNPNRHLFTAMVGVELEDLKCLIELMYRGNVTIPPSSCYLNFTQIIRELGMTDCFLTVTVKEESGESVDRNAIKAASNSTTGSSTQSTDALGRPCSAANRGNALCAILLKPRSDERELRVLTTKNQQEQPGSSRVDMKHRGPSSSASLRQETFGGMPSNDLASTPHPSTDKLAVTSLPRLKIVSVPFPVTCVRRAEEVFQRFHQEYDNAHPQASGYNKQTESRQTEHLAAVLCRADPSNKTDTASVIAKARCDKYPNEATNLVRQPAASPSDLRKYNITCTIRGERESSIPNVLQTVSSTVFYRVPDTKHKRDNVHPRKSSPEDKQSRFHRSECLEAKPPRFTEPPNKPTTASGTNAEGLVIPGSGKYSQEGIYLTRQGMVPSRSLLRKNNPSYKVQGEGSSPKTDVPVIQTRSSNPAQRNPESYKVKDPNAVENESTLYTCKVCWLSFRGWTAWHYHVSLFHYIPFS